MRKTLIRLIAAAYIRLKYALHARKLVDSASLQLPLSDLEGNVWGVTMSGHLWKTFTWVELNLMYSPDWSDNHLFAFYEGVISLVGSGEISKPKLLMFLHPEAYVQEVVFEEVDVMGMIEPESKVLYLPPAPGENDGVAQDDQPEAA